MQIGLEIEINSTNYNQLLKVLLENIDFEFSPSCSKTNSTKLIIKPEPTTKGLELNIPPNYTQLEYLINLIKPYIYFVDNAALHVHISDECINENTLDDYFNYYCGHEKEIIEEAKQANVYVNLNKSLKILNPTNRKFSKFVNLNIYPSFKEHGTIEHRIYKATLDIDKINWCIEQTKKIIRKEY